MWSEGRRVPAGACRRAGLHAQPLAELDPCPAPTPPNNSVSISASQPTLVKKNDCPDKLFKLLNIVVCVPITLFKIEFIANTDKPDVIILPTTFNVDIHVDALFKVVVPDTVNVDINVEGLLKLTSEGGFNIAL